MALAADTAEAVWWHEPLHNPWWEPMSIQPIPVCYIDFRGLMETSINICQIPTIHCYANTAHSSILNTTVALEVKSKMIHRSILDMVAVYFAACI